MAIVNPQDELYTCAQNWAAAVHEPLLTTEYVLLELVNSLSDPVDRPKAHAVVNEIRHSASWELVDASSQLFAEGLALHIQRSDKSWSLTDCISFVVMQQRGLDRALAFDHHFEQAGFQALLRRDPP